MGWLVVLIIFFSGANGNIDKLHQRNKPTSALFCTKIPLPIQSHFIGLDPPIDQRKWNDAIDTVCRGELVLLKRVHERVHRYEDIYAPDRFFRWNHHFSDIIVQKGDDFSAKLLNFSKDRAPILHLGRRYFEKPNFKGELTDWKGYGPNLFIDFKGSFPRKTILIGAMDENWGWLSTNFLNR
jgi:hypothetical protein